MSRKIQPRRNAHSIARFLRGAPRSRPSSGATARPLPPHNYQRGVAGIHTQAKTHTYTQQKSFEKSGGEDKLPLSAPVRTAGLGWRRGKEKGVGGGVRPA